MSERIRNRLLGTILVACATIACLGGCDKHFPLEKAPGTAGNSANDGTAAESRQLSAEQILHRMLTAYRKCQTYRDEATITLAYRQGGRLFTDEAPLAVALTRPNQLRVRAYQVTLACDGRELRGFITDPTTRNIDGQFLARPAPEQLNLATLLDDPLLADQLGNALVLPEASRLPLQLAFLLSNERVALLTGKDTQLEFLEPGNVDGHACVCIAAKTVQGTFRFWVDRQEFLLRRLEYPREALVARIADADDVRDLQLVANFKNATFRDAPAAETFVLAIPDEVKRVRFFVPPPQPLPSDKLGQTIDSFELSTPSGEKVTSQSLAGRIAVLLWFSSHAECEPSLRQFGEVHQKFSDDAGVAFYAVSTEPSSVSHQKLRELLKSWHVATPLARDLAAHGRDLLDINDTPTLVVLNGAGELQMYEVGVNPLLSEQLPQVLKKLLDGEDLAATILRQQELEQQQYVRRLALASGVEPLSVVDVPNIPLAEASSPKKLRLDSRWKCETLKQSGNLVVIEPAEETESPRIMVLDDGRRLVELNLVDGEVKKSIELDLPADVAVQRFRTVTDKAGHRFFAAWMGLGKYVYLLSEDGKHLATYPPEDARHDGVRDVLFADLNADGAPELYVAFLGAAGVHGVSFEGQRLWSSRSVGSILSLTASSPNPVGWRKLIAVGAQGQIVRFNQFGNADPPHAISGWTLAQLNGEAPADGNRPAPLCGLGIDREGKFCALALNEQLAEQWNYPLPEGVWRSAVEPLQSTRLLGKDRPAWLIAAVDGGMHVVSDDGNVSDYWHLGFLPTGIATLRTPDGKAVLLIASETGVAAWDVTAGE